MVLVSSPFPQALEMLSNACDSIPLIFLITDGSVEDERQICNVVKRNLENRGSMSPRISTFGIGKDSEVWVSLFIDRVFL